MTELTDRRFVLDLPVDPLPLDGAVERIAQVIQAHRAQGALTPLQIVTLNAEMAMQALQDAELAEIIKHCGLVVPDGSGVVWALGRHGERVRKVAGVDLVRAMAARAARDGFRIFFLGAKPGVAREAADNLAEQYPGMAIAGCRDGYFQEADEPALLEEIRASKADILLVALGVPRQEKWLARYQQAAGVPVAMGVGGSFDVFAGRVKRAPAGFQRLHIEWLYRLIQEPWRFQRMQSTLPAFVGEVLKRG